MAKSHQPPVPSRFYSIPGLSRRTLLKGAGAAGLATGIGLSGRPRIQAKQSTPTIDISGTSLRILQWEHFVPSHDEWFDPFVQEWGAANGVEVTVDHINTADIPSNLASQIAAGEGYDLVEHISPLANLEASLMDLTDVHEELDARYGAQVDLCRQSSYNPTTGKLYSLTHGWAPDPGNYRRSLWETAGRPEGPTTWQDLIDVGAPILNEQGIQMGIGMSNEIDSNMAALAMIWSFGGRVQDENENVALDSPETIAAVEFMAELYNSAMTPEVFSWNAASNNQLLVAGQASYILNSISAYRSAQAQRPDVAEDVLFSPALTGPGGEGYANGHAIMNYMIPTFAANPDTAKEFLFHFVDNYALVTENSQLYNFPAWAERAPELTAEGGWLDADPFGSQPADKLNVLKTAPDWTVHVGWPGPTNAVMGDVFAQFILPDMMRKVANDGVPAADAVAEAAGLVQASFDTWAAEGLVGGGR